MKNAAKYTTIVFTILSIVGLVIASISCFVSIQFVQQQDKAIVLFTAIFMLAIVALPTIFGLISINYINKDKKSIGMGICNLLFVNIISGILMIIWAADSSTSGKNEVDKVEAIEKYKRLFDEGVITEEEFETKKKELLK